MDFTISVLGALIALAIAIFVIIRGYPAVYGMLLGAIIGGIIGGGGIIGTMSIMIEGASGMSGTLLRIVAAGILAGTLIGSGAADTISLFIVKKLGETKSLVALTLATFILTGIGVFGDVAIITVAPIGIVIGQRARISKFATLFAMVGGVKAGNIVSPNPNTIAAAEPFDIPLTNLMIAGYIPAIFGIIATCFIAKLLIKKGSDFEDLKLAQKDKAIEKNPKIIPAIIGPLISIILLVLRPLFGIAIDPIIALPIGGITGLIAMGKIKYFKEFSELGLNRMSSVVLLLLGTGAIAGIISHSSIQEVIINLVENIGLPGYVLASIAGITMGAATASATGGASVGGNIFGPSILNMGVKPLQASQMIYTGTLWFDSLPHGSFFHVSSGTVNMILKERLKMLPFELLIGIIMSIASTVAYGLIGINF